ncbi:MAG: outer membrane protein assembly factor BamE [Alphaproteobacteria bacterium]|nr:outer membrane protein assembly factor BamE [Alphaproteobacteria bacterium]
MIRIAAMLVALGLVLAGCTPAIDYRGYVVPEQAVEKIAAGTATRAEVLETLGSPSSMAALDDKTWYYVGETTRRESFLDAELIERHILILRFDDAGLLSEVGTMDAKSGKEVILVRRETPTAGHSLTILEQILGNIGRFSQPAGSP